MSEDTPNYDLNQPIDTMRELMAQPAPPLFINFDKLPALLDAFAFAQAEYAPVVRNRLVVQKLKDRETNRYTGQEIRFLYAELETILDATRPFLSKHGLSFSQPLTTEVSGRTWINSILAHKDGGMIITRVIVPEAKSMKDFAGNITYFRRYAAGPALGVSSEDDADNGGDGGDGDGGDGGGRGEDDETDQRIGATSKPERAVPQRRTSAPTKTAAAGKSIEGHINAGQVKFLQGKLKALKLSDVDAQALFERMGIDGFSEAMDLATFAKVQTELDRLRDV